MEIIINNIAFFVAFIIVSYAFAKRKRLDMEAKSNPLYTKDTNELKKELKRRSKIAEKVDSFIKTSKFIEPIATWKQDKIYKYIFNNGHLYEFEDILPEKSQRIGLDDNSLCFKQFFYKRVNNPSEFIEKFSNELNK